MFIRQNNVWIDAVLIGHVTRIMTYLKIRPDFSMNEAITKEATFYVILCHCIARLKNLSQFVNKNKLKKKCSLRSFFVDC